VHSSQLQTPPPSLRGRCHHNASLSSSTHKPAAVVMALQPPSSRNHTFLTCLVAKVNAALSLPHEPPHLRTVDAALFPSPQTTPTTWHVGRLNCCGHSIRRAAASRPRTVSMLVRPPHCIHTSNVAKQLIFSLR